MVEKRDYGAIVRRVEAVAPWCEVRELGVVAGYPVLAVRTGGARGRDPFYVNAGTHGDEPAGVEAALAFLEGTKERVSGLPVEVIPCLSPFAYVHDTRLNREGVDINWSYNRDDVPEIALVRAFVEGRRFPGVIDLHEDWESPGYYLYEQLRNRDAAGPTITRRVAEVCPINTQPMIENEVARDGVIFPNMEVARRRGDGGVPIVLFRGGHTDHLITSETPSALPMPIRVKAHLLALATMLEMVEARKAG